MAEWAQQVTGGTVAIALADQGCTGKNAVQQASNSGIKLEVVKHTEAKKGLVLLPRTFWLGQFRCLTHDYGYPAEVMAGWHWLAFLLLISRM